MSDLAKKKSETSYAYKKKNYIFSISQFHFKSIEKKEIVGSEIYSNL